jgi:hypothetical protein
MLVEGTVSTYFMNRKKHMNALWQRAEFYCSSKWNRHGVFKTNTHRGRQELGEYA